MNPGDILYKYELIRHIGGGHFGEVWLANDLTISRQVAVKILDEKMAPIAEHLKEAQVGNRLVHPNVVHVHYADIVNMGQSKKVIIAMDFHPAGSIMSQLNAGNYISILNALKITIDILRGLEYLHECGLFHNDIKPSNILIGAKGEGVITDYGISGLSPDLSPTQAPMAYLLHRAPETGQTNQITVQTDIYQTGLTLFRLINGVGLIRNIKNSVGDAQFENLKINEKIPRKTDYQAFVPAQLRRIISKSTRSNPVGRYQSALEMRRALESISFQGYWSMDSNGRLFGFFKNQVFRFEEEKDKKMYNVTSYRKRLGSGNESRVLNFCGRRLERSEAKKMIRTFMQDVVCGNI